MKTCIICRIEKQDNEFNKEHVIPDSINGYYIINTVCKKCNSTIGSKIDSKLTNHSWIKFVRWNLKIKGKSGTIPNPFSGTLNLRDNKTQKLRFEPNEENVFEIKLIPNIPKKIIDKNFTITIDAKDEHKIDEIIDKFLKRKGISKKEVNIQKRKGQKNRPWIESSLLLDFKEFKLALLKIAYEFAVENIPKYFKNKEAIAISKILLKLDFKNLYTIDFYGDGFNDKILEPFKYLIDFKNNNHYLILFDTPDFGLLCFINIFDTFNIVIRLSKKYGLIKESIIVGKNDMLTKKFSILTLDEVMKLTYTNEKIRFGYHFKSINEQIEFQQASTDPKFEFYQKNNSTPFFYSNGNIAYNNLYDKLKQPQLDKLPIGDTINEITTQIQLDENLFIKILPTNKLYQVLSVRLERHRNTKI